MKILTVDEFCEKLVQNRWKISTKQPEHAEDILLYSLGTNFQENAVTQYITTIMAFKYGIEY